MCLWHWAAILDTEGDEYQLNSKATCKDDHSPVDSRNLGIWLKSLKFEHEYELIEHLILIFLISESIHAHAIKKYSTQTYINKN